MTKDEDNIPKKYDLDLDELSDDKPIVINTSKFKPENRVDFTKTSEQNKGRYISIGQIEELAKLPEDEQKRIKSDSLTDEHLKDIEGHRKTITDLGSTMSKSISSMFNLGSSNIKLPTFNTPDIARFMERPDPIAIMPNIEARPTAKQQREQTAILQDLADSIKAQNKPENPALLRLLEPRFDRRKHVLIFANTPIKFAADSDADLVCRRLFRDSKPVKHAVEKGELIELLAIRDATPAQRKKALYNRIVSINRIIEKETGAEKLFDFVDKKLWFNTIYVKLPL
jgi:hypothetical protein